MGGTGPVSAAVVVQHAVGLDALHAAIVEPDTDAMRPVVVTIYEVAQ